MWPQLAAAAAAQEGMTQGVISLASSMGATGAAPQAVTAHRPGSLVLNSRRVGALESMHCSRCCKAMLYHLLGITVAAKQQVQFVCRTCQSLQHGMLVVAIVDISFACSDFTAVWIVL